MNVTLRYGSDPISMELEVDMTNNVLSSFSDMYKAS